MFEHSLYKLMHVGVFKQDNYGDETLIGSAAVAMRSIIAAGNLGKDWFELHNQGHRVGEVRLGLSFQKDVFLSDTRDAAERVISVGSENASDNSSPSPPPHHSITSSAPEQTEPKLELYADNTTKELPVPDGLDAQLERMRKQVDTNEFWAPEKGVNSCPSCGESFSVFRRKHHCRTCGNIFDSKCLTEIDGWRLSVLGKLIVCKACLAVIEGSVTLDATRHKVDVMAARILRIFGDDAYDEPVWRQFRQELVDEGFSGNFLDQNKARFPLKEGRLIC